MGCVPSIAQGKTSRTRIIQQSSVIKSHALNDEELSEDYVPNKYLGTGAYSEVLLNYYKPLQTYRAMKIIKKNCVTSSRIDSNYILLEYKILKKLSHPNIIKVYGQFEDKYSFYLPLEYCEGGDLSNRLRKMKTFTEHQSAKIIYQILNALKYIHQNSIIHRDIKLKNVLLTYNDKLDIKISDFGTACYFDGVGKPHDHFGTKYFLAPEAFTNDYNEKIDIWSTGILLYALLTGAVPYIRRNDKRDNKRKVFEPPIEISERTLPQCSAELIKFINSLLEIDPRLRPSAETAIKDPWIVAYSSERKNKIELIETNTNLVSMQVNENDFSKSSYQSIQAEP